MLVRIALLIIPQRGNKILREVRDVRICGVGGVAGLNF